jgi:hypothetical protein
VTRGTTVLTAGLACAADGLITGRTGDYLTGIITWIVILAITIAAIITGP